MEIKILLLSPFSSVILVLFQLSFFPLVLEILTQLSFMIRHLYLSKVLSLNFLEDQVFFFNYFIVIQLQLSAFSPTTNPLRPPPQPDSPLSLASTLALGFVHVSFIVVPENPSPHCPLLPPLWLLLDCS